MTLAAEVATAVARGEYKSESDAVLGQLRNGTSSVWRRRSEAWSFGAFGKEGSTRTGRFHSDRGDKNDAAPGFAALTQRASFEPPTPKRT
jgi:hypothetical protein